MPTYVIAEPELAAWLEANAKAAAESIEKSWWREPLQIVLASGDQKAIDTFVHCFKMIERIRIEAERCTISH